MMTIDKILSDRGMRLADLARALGLNKSSVTRWAKGKVPAERIGEVSRVVGVPPEIIRPDLFAGVRTGGNTDS